MIFSKYMIIFMKCSYFSKNMFFVLFVNYLGKNLKNRENHIFFCFFPVDLNRFKSSDLNQLI